MDMVYLWYLGVAFFEILLVISGLLFMYYSAKHRNKQLHVGWYICGVFFTEWTLICFLVKRKDFPKADSKVCYMCDENNSEEAVQCEKCGAPLPHVNAQEKQKDKKLSRKFGTAVICSLILAVVVAVVGIVLTFTDDFNFDMTDRIAVDGVFYDKKGNVYEDGDDVLLYDESGNAYTYTVEECTDSDGWTYDEYFYISDDGKKYLAYDCYVTEDGWFYCDKAGVLEIGYEDTSSMSEEELDEYYKNRIETYGEYRYYNDPYTDAEGNRYYDAYEASWNEKGELITAKNDPTAKN